MHLHPIRRDNQVKLSLDVAKIIASKALIAKAASRFTLTAGRNDQKAFRQTCWRATLWLYLAVYSLVVDGRTYGG